MSKFLGTKYNVLGVNINVLNRQLFLKRVKDTIENKEKIIIFTPYSEFIYKACIDPKFKDVLNSADINIADGVFVQIISIYKERVKKSRIRIINLFKIFFLIFRLVFRKVERTVVFPELLSGSNEVLTLCNLAQNNNYSIYLVGGSQNVVYLAAQKLKDQFPRLNIVGAQSGIAFSPDDKKLFDDIRVKKPDMLFVCYGGQKQEKWIAVNKEKLNARVIIGLGGTFDYLSGKRKLQSKWWSDRGLNWLHRLISEPVRIKRQTALLKLAWILAGVKD